jgi:hypothetical protein
LLGGSILGQKRFSEAEPLLLTSYEGMKQREDEMPIDRRDRVGSALERIVQLYTEWGKPAQAADWKKKLEAFEKAQPKQKTSSK